MLNQSKIYELEIDRMRLQNILAVFTAVSLLFLCILSVGSMGPKKLIIDPVTDTSCEDVLTFSDDDGNINQSESYKCILCKEFRADQSSKIMNFRLDLYAPSKDLKIYREYETKFNISVLESDSTLTSCSNLALTSKQSSFPMIDKSLYTDFNKKSKSGTWDIVLNNTEMYGRPDCTKRDERTGKFKCVTDIYGEMDFSQESKKLAIMLTYPLSKEQKAKKEQIDFFLIYNNEDFYKFILLFQILISIASLAAFAYVLHKLLPYKFQDWLAIHKWILALLLTQAFLDNSFSILNDFVESRIFEYMSEIGKNVHLILLLYYWVSVFDRILIQHLQSPMFNEWAEKIKVILLTSLFILNFGYNIYISIESLENEYKELFHLRVLLDFIKFLITFLEVSYGVYFIILTSLYIRLLRRGKLRKDTSSLVLFGFTSISFVLTTISLTLSPYSEGSFDYLAVRGFIGIYTITVGILYVPCGLRKAASELDMTTMHEREEIMKNAYGTDSGSSDEEHKSSSVESIDDIEQQKKKMIWERIQKQVETEEEEEGQDKVDKGKDEELEDDEEYIYM